MRFLPTGEQSEFARTLRRLLGASDLPGAVRAWQAGDTGPGLGVWRKLGGTGLFALPVPEAHGGLGPLPVELALGFVELGRAGMPGPAVETATASVLLAALAGANGAQGANRAQGAEGAPGAHGVQAAEGAAEPAKRFLPALAAGEARATVVLPGGGPYALDADTADHRFTVSADGELRLAAAPDARAVRVSTDPARRLAALPPGGELLASGPAVLAAAATALRWARLLTAAQCVGLGEALLTRTVEYAKQRTQFGTPIGSFQAVKHRLADVLLRLEFARPVLWAGALSLADGATAAGGGGNGTGGGDGGPGDGGPGRTVADDVAAAKLTAGEAAYAAARAALQLHGAVGYTEELDLSLWLRKARPLRDAWGTPQDCRAAVVAEALGQAGRFSCQETPKRSLTQPKRALKP
ncbi:acyl-CoA dehydrogenase family protein [Streptomyces sp. NPDC007369]|uniref:acyl-CoA dehydrogenase family protein n=1 Tax=Streptomyces sp. NPDC007369 TaxID=3154589 RepID=UPI0033D8A73B